VIRMSDVVSWKKEDIGNERMGRRVLYVDEDAVRYSARPIDVRSIAVMCGMFAKYGNMRFADDRGYYAKENALRAIVSMQNEMGDMFANNLHISNHMVMMLMYRPLGLHDRQCVYGIGIDLVMDERVRYNVDAIEMDGDDLIMHAAGVRIVQSIPGLADASSSVPQPDDMRLTHGDWQYVWRLKATAGVYHVGTRT